MADDWSFEHGGLWQEPTDVVPGEMVRMVDMLGKDHVYLVTEVRDDGCVLLPDPDNGQFVMPFDFGCE